MLAFGANNPSANNAYFAGSLDGFRIYNRVLSAAEIAMLYQN